jgi:hypothetical protein
MGGSDDENNLIVLCKSCHKKLQNGLISLKKNGKRKGNLKHAAQMNIIRAQLSMDNNDSSTKRSLRQFSSVKVGE